MSVPPKQHNLAARMAVWGSRHHRKAIWGWLGLVVILVALGSAVGTTQISDVDQFSGESHRAEVALHDAGLRPVKEVVFVQSDKLTVKDPAFRAAVSQVAGRLSRMEHVSHVRTPLTGASEVSADQHAALVKFR